MNEGAFCSARTCSAAPRVSAVSPVRSPLAARPPEVLRHSRAVPARHRVLRPSRCLRDWRAGCPATPETGPAGPPASYVDGPGSGKRSRCRAGTARLCRRTSGGRAAKGLRTGLTALTIVRHGRSCPNHPRRDCSSLTVATGPMLRTAADRTTRDPSLRCTVREWSNRP